MIPLRRQDRQIKDFNKIVDLINKCQTIHVGMVDDNKPYVVALSYGYKIKENNKVVFYLHGAKSGRKKDIIIKNSNVFVGLDILHGYVDLGKALTADYESITAEGTMSIVNDYDEKVEGIKLLCEHCGFSSFNASECVSKDITEVFKIECTNIIAKSRFKANE